MSAEDFRYDGKTVLVIGGATGMGAAAAQTVSGLGGELVVMDVVDVEYPVASFIKVDLRDQASVDAAVDQVTGPIHAVFSCAGVADGTPGLMQINFIAHRHILDRLLDDGKLGEGASISFVSSVAGIGWENSLERVLDFLAADDWKSATTWIDEHEGTDSYLFSKQVINAYVAHEAFRLLKDGVRVNCILPGPTDTPLAQQNPELWLSFGEGYRTDLGRGPMSAEQMGNTLAFLGSEAASGIAGTTVLVDLGQVSSAVSGSYPDPLVHMLRTM